MADSILKQPGAPKKPAKNRKVRIQMIKGEETEESEENERSEAPTNGWFTEFLIGCGCLPLEESYEEE